MMSRLFANPDNHTDSVEVVGTAPNNIAVWAERLDLEILKSIAEEAFANLKESADLPGAIVLKAALDSAKNAVDSYTNAARLACIFNRISNDINNGSHQDLASQAYELAHLMTDKKNEQIIAYKPLLIKMLRNAHTDNEAAIVDTFAQTIIQHNGISPYIAESALRAKRILAGDQPTDGVTILSILCYYFKGCANENAAFEKENLLQAEDRLFFAVRQNVEVRRAKI